MNYIFVFQEFNIYTNISTAKIQTLENLHIMCTVLLNCFLLYFSHFIYALHYMSHQSSIDNKEEMRFLLI